MARRHLTVGVIAATRPGAPGFVPVAILPAAPATPAGSSLGAAGGVTRVYAGAATIALHPGETGHYRDNLISGRPSIWVALKNGSEPVIALVTVDPYEGEGAASDPGLVVEALPMPEPIRVEVSAFFAAHHVEEPFVKRKRNRADPEAMGRGRVRVLDLRDER